MTVMFDIRGIDSKGKDSISVGGQLYSEHWEWAMKFIDSSPNLAQLIFRFYII